MWTCTTKVRNNQRYRFFNSLKMAFLRIFLRKLIIKQFEISGFDSNSGWVDYLPSVRGTSIMKLGHVKDILDTRPCSVIAILTFLELAMCRRVILVCLCSCFVVWHWLVLKQWASNARDDEYKERKIEADRNKENITPVFNVVRSMWPTSTGEDNKRNPLIKREEYKRLQHDWYTNYFPSKRCT